MARSQAHHKTLRRLIYLSSALGVLAAGAYFGARPLLMRILRDNQPVLEEKVSALAGVPVSFGEVEVRWDWFLPEFDIRDIRLGEAVSVSRAGLRVELVPTLRHRRLHIGAVHTGTVRIHLTEGQDGSREAGGLEKAGGGANGAVAAPWLSRNLEIEAKEVIFRAVPGGAEPVDASVSGLEGTLTPVGTGLNASLSWKALELSVPSWWEKPLHFGAVSGGAAIRFEEKGAVINLKRMAGELEESGFSLRGEWRAGGTQRWDLRVNSVRAADAPFLFPASVVEPGFRHWLEQALSRGTFEDFSVELERGSEGWNTALGSSFRGLSLKYLGNWPLLHEMRGGFELRDGTFVMHAETAGWGKMALRDAEARIDDVSRKAPRLRVNGIIDSSEAALTGFLRNGPLRAETAALLGYVTPVGAVSLSANLDIVLGDADPKPVFGAEILKGGLRAVSLDVTAGEVRGRFRADKKGLEVDGLEGRLFERRFSAAGKYAWLTPERDRGRGSFEVTGTVPLEWALDRAGRKEWKARLDGKADFTLSGEMEVGSGKEIRLLSVSGKSDLTGVAIALPFPLGKPPTLEMPARAQARWVDGRLEYLKADAAMGEREFSLSGTYRNERRNETKNLRLLSARVELPEIRWEEWSGEFGRDGEPIAPADLDLNLNWRAGKLLFKDLAIENLSADLSRGGGVWKGRVRSRAVGGEFEVATPVSRNTLKARFTHLILPKFPKGKEEEGVEEPEIPPEEESWDLSRWPSVDLKLDRLRVGPQLFGQAEVRLRQTGSRLEIERFHVGGPELVISVDRGDFAYGSFRVSGLEGTVDVKKTVFPTRLPKLKAIGMRNAEMKFKLVWPGGPDAFSLKRLSGSLSGRIREGALRGVESGAVDLFNFLSYTTGDSRRKRARFYKSVFDVRFRKGPIQVEKMRALFGSVYVRVRGEANARTDRLDLVACVRPGISDLEHWDDDQRFDEPACLTSHSITGTWKQPEVSLKLF